MKINFDSNVWQIVANPEDFATTEPSINDFRIIKQAIIDGKITPLLTETMFTLEAIKRKERKDFFTEYEPRVEITEDATEKGINIKFLFGPDPEAHPGNTEQLERYLSYATNLGFKILKYPRIGGMLNPHIEKYFFQNEGEELKKYLDKAFKVGREIEKAGAGIAFLKNIGYKYNSTKWQEGVKSAPDSETNAIGKAFAEWADGDSVAAHIAFGGDYFCTRDAAGGAGSKSVFSAANQGWLSTNYDFKTITPEDLAKLL